MRAKEGNERTSKVVAAIQKKDDIIVDITEEVPYLNLEYSGHDIEKVKEDTYKFTQFIITILGIRQLHGISIKMEEVMPLRKQIMLIL